MKIDKKLASFELSDEALENVYAGSYIMRIKQSQKPDRTVYRCNKCKFLTWEIGDTRAKGMQWCKICREKTLRPIRYNPPKSN